MDRNLRQSRAEKKVLEGKGVAWVARLLEAQPFRRAKPFWNNSY